MQQKSLSEEPGSRIDATPRPPTRSKNGKRIGRPPSYGPETERAILELMCKGRFLAEICQLEGMPHVATVMRWMDPQETTFRVGFRESYARAREICADRLAGEALAIADDPSGDWITRYDKRIGQDVDVPDLENVQRSRLRVDTRKWAASKLYPARYGDKVAAEISGPDGGPIQSQSVVVDIQAGLDAIRARMRESEAPAQDAPESSLPPAA